MTTTSESSTPARRRARRARRRSVGLWLILSGIALAAVGLFVLETTVYAPGLLVGCGSALAPAPGRGDVCGSALLELRLVGGGLAVAGAAALASGVAVRALTPRPLSF